MGNWRVILGEIQDTSSQTDIVREKYCLIIQEEM